MKARINTALGLFAALLVYLPSVSADDIYFAGRELSPGVDKGQVTYGVFFAGWTLDEEGWRPVSKGNGGGWMAIVDREGHAGFGSSVSIVGGSMSVQRPDGTLLGGRVIQGLVEWPLDQEDDIGCGQGVALVEADVLFGTLLDLRKPVPGEMWACLDDQEWFDLSDGVPPPPRIWGAIRLF